MVKTPLGNAELNCMYSLQKQHLKHEERNAHLVMRKVLYHAARDPRDVLDALEEIKRLEEDETAVFVKGEK